MDDSAAKRTASSVGVWLGVGGSLAVVMALVAWGTLREGDLPASRGEAASRSGDDPMQRALALRNQAKAGQARWPDGTSFLAEGKKFAYAVDRERDIIAASEAEIWRVPKDGSAPARIAELWSGDEAIRALAVTRGNVAVVLAFPKRAGELGVHAPGRLVLVGLEGNDAGALQELRRDVGILSQVAATPDAIYLEEEETKPSHLTRLVNGKSTTVASGEPSVVDWQLAGVAAAPTKGSRVVWIERARHGEDEDFRVRQSSRDGAASDPLPVPRGAVASTIAADDEKAYVVYWGTFDRQAPGGGTYYEQRGGVRSIDLASGAVEELASGLDNPWGTVVGATQLCVVESGPKLEFGKNAAVLAVSKRAGQTARKLATGLDHPTCLAADADHFYVTTAKGGIARVPVAP